MIPYKSIIEIDRKGKKPLYLQIANQLIELIKKSTLPPSTKLPSSRVLSELLNVHRKTIVACYDELMLQGWVDAIPKTGTFVRADIPFLQQQNFSNRDGNDLRDKLGFSFYENPLLKRKITQQNHRFIAINDGVSDERLAPIEEIAKIYRRIVELKGIHQYVGYDSTYGNPELRDALVNYLNETRGLHITRDNLLITRGSQMGIHLSSRLLLQQNDSVIVGETNYISADLSFTYEGANLLRVKVDEHGLDTREVADLCKKYAIKAVYVTSHHHHPTTVTLSAERRIHLLNLAQEFNFAIIEDDYDYDFHYNRAPILPLASHDENGHVIYIGSVCKTVAPVYRIGYLLGPKKFVDSCANLRRFIDRQGDSLLELAFANFIKHGDLDRHINKVMKVYKGRRDVFCALMRKELSDYISFETPTGGMAIWARLDKKYTWKAVAASATQLKLDVGDWQRYDPAGIGHNSIRIGFARFDASEMRHFVFTLKKSLLNSTRRN